MVYSPSRIRGNFEFHKDSNGQLKGNSTSKSYVFLCRRKRMQRVPLTSQLFSVSEVAAKQHNRHNLSKGIQHHDP
ncbi:hypothetical protein VNO77_18035 [Canavalia gladiata]|uniref:Uncharacterized protein n=1 Tax=Canavalia gladiata TaxID=3824 RepID=A0AAN9QJ89_CANGL